MKTKKVVFTLLSMVVLLGLLICCAPKAEPTPQTKEPTIKLLWACYRTPGDPRAAVYEHFCSRIEEETKGRVKITISYAEQIIKAPQEYDAVVSGTVDMAAPVVAYVAGRLQIPAMLCEAGYWQEPGDSLVIMSRLREPLSRMFEKDGAKFLGWGAEVAPQSLACNTRLIKLPSDCKGLKIRAGGIGVLAINAWGGTGVALPNSEIYMALQTGVIDGTLLGPDTMGELRIWEVAEYFTYIPGGGIPTPVLINLKKWESLPDDVKQVFEEVSREMAPWSYERSRAVLADIVADLETKFKESYTIPEKDRDHFSEATKGFYWKSTVDRLGAPAQEFWNAILSAADECAAARARGETPRFFED